MESESEFTDFDILKSVIGITDIRMIGKTLKIPLYSFEVAIILYLAYNCRANLTFGLCTYIGDKEGKQNVFSHN